MGSLARYPFGSAGGYIELTDTPSIVVSDGSTTSTLTSAILAGLTNISGYVWDVSAATTAAAYVALGSNLARAWELRQGSTAFLRAVTTTSKTFMQSVARWKFNGVQAVDMAGAAHALVLGTAGAGQTQLTGNIVTVDANGTGGGSSGQTLTLPAVADCDGVILFIINTGGETVTLSDVFTTQVATLKGATVACNGSVWAAIPGA